MKRILSVTGALVLLLLSCHDAKEKEETPVELAKEGYTWYVNSGLHFKLAYPASWDTTKKVPEMVFIAYDVDPDTTDQFREGLVISAFPTEGMTLEQTVEKNTAATKQYYPDATVSHSFQTNPHQVKYAFIEMNLVRKDVPLVSYTLLFSDGNNQLAVTMTIEKSKHDKYKPVFDKVAETFQWIN